jgi:phosphonoacetate hydrolase
LPPGSVRLGPLRAGDQGISISERDAAERAMGSLLTRAPGVHMVVFYDRETGEHVLRGRRGSIRYERWQTPDGELRYRITSVRGVPPVTSGDPTRAATLAEEARLGDGVGTPVRQDRTSFPGILDRMAQLWDHPRAPDFVYVPTTGGDPNHPGGGSHGVPDVSQSRAPLIIAGPGVRPGATTPSIARLEDVAPTVAQFLGVAPVRGRNGTSVERTQWLRWQDGVSKASAVLDARVGADATGLARRAIIITVDGLHQPAMLDEIAQGRLPNIARLMQRGTTFENGAFAQYPTVTWANHTTIATGATPGSTGMVNNSWYERAERREQQITDGGFANTLRTGRLLEPEVETLYEAVKRSFPGAVTAAINQPMGRGATISVLDLAGIGHLVGMVPRIAVDFVRGMFGGTVDRSRYDDAGYKRTSLQDNAGVAGLESLYRGSNVPHLSILELTLVDNQGHYHGPHHPQTRAAMQEADRQVGRVLDALERRGIAGSTMVVVTSDHGMEHQERDPAKLGGWFEALKESGVRLVESTRFVYVRTSRVGVVGPVPPAGSRGMLELSVVDDDADESGARPPLAGATVTVRDGAGSTWTGTVGTDGRIRLPVRPRRGPLEVLVTHPEVTDRRMQIPLPGDRAPARRSSRAR